MIASLLTLLRLARDRDWRMIVYLAKAKWRGLDLKYAGLEEIGLSEHRALFYADSGGPALERVLNSLSIAPADDALDIGCGKGGAILTFAQYPFRRVDGVELSERLIAVARENLRRMGTKRSTIYHCDAAVFPDYARYTFLYMFHPFPEEVIAETMRRIADSIEARLRKVTLIYNNPVAHSTVVAAGFRKTAELSGQFTPLLVYVADPVEKSSGVGSG